MESELVDMLPRRILKLGGLVGEVPERPIVVTDSRLRWGSKAPFACPLPPFAMVLEPRWKSCDRAACVTELRRWLVPLGDPSEAILGEFKSCEGTGC